ncbi:hypothetical protein [Spirosoma endophyticum]|uniref:Uncharacterized protein n=1 Tax=Spirosoma endophyticum TaxID=662367 RepID=A0A1I2E3L4_9BACT|nr:hypothetical protein [Spirosoma endophyticum]SFE87532.1 hypothetical protein SAMN05216167_12114 [Spirosoma endophyticum]
MEAQEQPEFTNMEKSAGLMNTVYSILRKEGYIREADALVAFYKVIEYRNRLEGQYQDQIEDWDKRMLNDYNKDVEKVLHYMSDRTREAERMGLPIVPNDERIANELQVGILRPSKN